MIINQLDVTSGSAVQLGAAPSPCTVNVRLCNRTNSKINISIAVVPSGTVSPGNAHWTIYAWPLDGPGMWEDTGIPLIAGDQIFVQAAASGISASLFAMLGA